MEGPVLHARLHETTPPPNNSDTTLPFPCPIDHWTVEKIKAEYSKRADEGLVDGDKLVFNDQELNENSQIYK